MVYSTKQLADLKGVSKTTFFRYMRRLKETGEFKKSSPGRFYSLEEAKQISKHLEFEL